MKKNLEKYIYICMKLNHFAVYLKLTQHYRSTILQYKIFKNKKKKQMQGESGAEFKGKVK